MAIQATPEVTAIRSAVDAFDSGYQDLGVGNCRKKRNRAGQTIGGWSQHAFGNAWDIRYPTHSQAKAVKRHLERNVPAAGFILDYGDGQLHIEGADTKSGTPPCAGGAPITDGGGGGGDVTPTPVSDTDSPEDRSWWQRALGVDIDPGELARRALYVVLGVVLLAAGAILAGADIAMGRAAGRLRSATRNLTGA